MIVPAHIYGILTKLQINLQLKLAIWSNIYYLLTKIKGHGWKLYNIHIMSKSYEYMALFKPVDWMSVWALSHFSLLRTSLFNERTATCFPPSSFSLHLSLPLTPLLILSVASLPLGVASGHCMFPSRILGRLHRSAVLHQTALPKPVMTPLD